MSAAFNSVIDDLYAILNTTRPVAYGGTGGTSVITGWDGLAKKGTDIATASSINLTTATGPSLSLTGTTTIATVTLAEGSIRLVRANAAFTITASASLLCNGSASADLSVSAEDLLVFRGGASSVVSVAKVGASVASLTGQGVVELATVAEALTGTDAVRAVTPAGLYYPTGHLSGATIINNAGSAANKIDVAAGTARNSADTANIALAAAITAKDITVAWAVGGTAGLLDTGSVANTTYYVYLIKRVDTGVVDVVASTSSSAPTLPTNYTLYRQIGYFVRASATNGLPKNLNKPTIEYTGAAPVFACRAFVNFKGSGTVTINASGNVSSITDNGVGDYTINFTTAMADANYAVAGTVSKASTDERQVITGKNSTSPTASAWRFFALDNTGAANDSDGISVAFFR